MHEIGPNDEVAELAGVPQSSVGTPCPVVVADEFSVAVAFYLEEADPDWDGRTVKVVGAHSVGEPHAVVVFDGVWSSMFGPPNDEAFSGHPLADRGLKPHGAYEVVNSSWVRKLEAMNRVHPHHSPNSYDDLRHLILSFHDSTFECVARSFSTSHGHGPVIEAAAATLKEMAK